jgi:hypothetical protein
MQIRTLLGIKQLSFVLPLAGRARSNGSTVLRVSRNVQLFSKFDRRGWRDWCEMGGGMTVQQGKKARQVILLAR